MYQAAEQFYNSAVSGENTDKNSNAGITGVSDKERAPSTIAGSLGKELKDVVKNPFGAFREGKFDALGKAYGINLAGYNQDITSVENIWKGKATSKDFGGIVGAAIGGIFGEGDDEAISAGRSAGQTLFPAITKLTKGANKLFKGLF